MRKCVIEGCEGKHKARGFCEKHYKRWKKGRMSNSPPGREVSARSGRGSERTRRSWDRLTRSTPLSAHAGVPSPRVEKVGGFNSGPNQKCRVKRCKRFDSLNGYCQVHYNRLLLIQNCRPNKSKSRAGDYFEEEIEVVEDVAYPEDVDEVSTDNKMFLYNLIDKGLSQEMEYD